MKLEARVVKILRVLGEAKEPLSCKEIASRYIENPTSSDALTTGTICHILSFVDLAKRIETPRGRRAVRVQYK